MSPEQCRAARAWLGWSQSQLAKRADLSAATVRDFETGRRIPIANNLKAILGALEAAGIHFDPLGISFPKPNAAPKSDKPKPSRSRPSKARKRR